MAETLPETETMAPHPDSGPPTEESTGQGLPAVVIDLGKVKRKSIRQLKEGQGKILQEVDDVVGMVREELAGELEGREILPVVVLYEKRSKKKDGWLDP